MLRIHFEEVQLEQPTLGSIKSGSIFMHPGSRVFYMKTMPLCQSKFGIKVINIQTGVESDAFNSKQHVVPLDGDLELYIHGDEK